MKIWSRLLLASLLLNLGAWGQTGKEEAPKSRRAHPAGVHKMGHAARQLSEREKRENASLRAEKRRQAKLAKKQRKDAKRRSRTTRKAVPST